MLTDISPATLNACLASMMVSEMAFPKTAQDTYELLRGEAVDLLRGIEGFEDFDLPPTAQAMREKEVDVIAEIMERLSRLRSRVNGDVLPLTFFMLAHCVWRGMVLAAFDPTEQWQPYRGLAGLCCRELGLEEHKEIAALESQARGLIRFDSEGKNYIRDRDRIDAAADILRGIFESVHDRWSSPPPLDERFALLQRTVEDFRRESREQHAEILESIASLRQEVVARLVVEGVSPAEAESVIDLESESFLDRLQRWSKNKRARDAVEAAVWAALDFVPGGTGVKLGIKVLGAVRKSLKQSGSHS